MTSDQRHRSASPVVLPWRRTVWRMVPRRMARQPYRFDNLRSKSRGVGIEG